MEEKARVIKRIKILVIFLAIVFSFIFIASNNYLNRPTATCFDGIKNQNEEDIDCGGSCLPCLALQGPIILEKFLFERPSKEFTVLAKIKNPNLTKNLKSMKIKVNFYDEKGALAQNFTFEDYILAQQEKYFVSDSINLFFKPSDFEILIEEPIWEQAKDISQRTVIDKKTIRLEDTEKKIIVEGEVVNFNPFNLDEVQVVTILFDDNLNIVGGGRTYLENILVRSRRDFRIEIPFSGGSLPREFIVESYVNI